MMEVNLFKGHSDVTKEACDEYARGLVTGSSPTQIKQAAWQGFHSYTLLLGDDGGTVLQFRSRESPLDQDTADLAKAVHGPLAPKTEFLGRMPGAEVSVCRMERLPGVGFLTVRSESLTAEMLDLTMVSFAK